MLRLVRLTLRFSWASRVKFALLSLLVAVGMVVFLVVTELSRVSSADLDEAIAQDVGETGTYVVDVGSNLGLSTGDLAPLVSSALKTFSSRPVTMVDVLPPIQPECPPFEELGSQPLYIMRDAAGMPIALPFGEGLPIETEFCFDGQEIPASAVYLPDQAEQNRWGSGVFIESSYGSLAALSTVAPIAYRFTVVTGEPEDQRTSIERHLHEALQSRMDRFGVRPGDTLFVRRADTGEGIREASEGIKIVYAIIGWGVLALGGLALLVTELIVVRDRTWFFGLARSLGAKNRHVAALVTLDVALVLGAGVLAAVLLALTVQPTASSFARAAFDVDVQLVQASALKRLVAGAVALLVAASAYPGWKAVHEDPLDVLEGGR